MIDNVNIICGNPNEEDWAEIADLIKRDFVAGRNLNKKDIDWELKT